MHDIGCSKSEALLLVKMLYLDIYPKKVYKHRLSYRTKHYPS